MSKKICPICPEQEDCPHKDNRTECREFVEAIKRHRSIIVAEIWEERERQYKKRGEQNLPMLKGAERRVYCQGNANFYKNLNAEPDHRSWYTIIHEEFYKTFTETDPEKQREGMVRFAAIAVAIIECLDRKK